MVFIQNGTAAVRYKDDCDVNDDDDDYSIVKIIVIFIIRSNTRESVLFPYTKSLPSKFYK